MKTYVVGIDGSDTAAEAARRAGSLAAATGGTVHVVCAYAGRDSSTIQVGSDSFVVSSTDGGRAGRRAAGRERSAARGSTATPRPWRTSRLAVLIDEAERLQADVIVVGNRRMQGVGRSSAPSPTRSPTTPPATC